MKNKAGIRMAVCGCLAAFAPVTAASAAYISLSSGGEGYILQEHEGQIAIYSAAKQRDMLTLTDIETGTLPSADRESLERGIFVGDEEALLQLLEDFGS